MNLCRALFHKETLLLIILLAFVWVIVGKPISQGLAKELENMGVTSHAQTEHQDQPWNAETIREQVISGKCVPREYFCDNDTQIVYCLKEGHPEKAIGLIIGRTSRLIVTAFEGKTKQWQNRCP
jgi:hypothetical protein